MHKMRPFLLFLTIVLCCCQGAVAQYTVPEVPDQTSQAPARTGQPASSSACLERDAAGDCISETSTQPVTKGPTPIINRPMEAPPERQETKPRITQAPPPQETTDFQKFVFTSTGLLLPQFGHNLFTDQRQSFAVEPKITPTGSYIIGPDDQLLIHGWGQLDIDYTAKVDRDGSIYIPRVGSVQVAGVRYDRVTEVVRNAIARTFKNFEVTVNLGKIRSLQVFVVGRALRPGAYTVSSLNTLVNAIFASGGPSPSGSMRRIELRRGSSVVTVFDLYDLLIHGDKSKDVQLQPEDVIYFPPIGDEVAITGSVNAPAIYELKQGVTLNDALDLAGGLSTVAEGQRVTVERIEGRATRRVDQFNLDAEGLKRDMHDGDLVRVISVLPRIENAVTLRGNVSRPGRYPWRPGMRLRDLVNKPEDLLTPDFWQTQNQLVQRRSSASNIRKQVGPNGASVNTPDTTVEPTGPTPENTRLSASVEAGDRAEVTARNTDSFQEEIRLAAPEINWDYALIERLSKADLTTLLLPFSPRRAFLDKDPEENLELEPGDIVTVFSQSDIRVPIDHQTLIVRLEGEFNSSGVYRAFPSETLRSLVARSGGLTPKAYLFGAEFTRESNRKAKQARYDEVLDSLERQLDSYASTTAKAAASPENAIVFKDQIESQRRLLQKLRGVKVKGQVVLEIKPWASGVESLPEMTLEDGDRLLIPSQPAEVNVYGAVYNENSFLYGKNKRMRDYLKEAGGPRKGADAREIFVIRADGSVVSRKSSGASLFDLKLMPGDSIVVPEQLDKIGLVRNLKDILQIISDFALGAAAARTISRP